LENIIGKYVGFVDPDDWIEPNMYEVLHKAVKDRNVPISVASYFKDATPIQNKMQIPHDTISVKDMLLYPLKRDYYMGFCGYMWNKLFAADIRLYFNEKLNYCEDVLSYANAVIDGKCEGVYIDKPLYHYCQRKESISHSKLINVKADSLTVYKKFEELLNKNGYSDISYWARGFYCHHISVIAEIAQKEIKNHLSDYVETNREFPEKFERMREILNGQN